MWPHCAHFLVLSAWRTSREPNIFEEADCAALCEKLIITPDMMPFNCRGVFNSSVVKHADKYVMVLRCEGYNFFALAESSNGLDDWKTAEIISLPEDDECRKYARVQYDPRIT